MISVIQWFVRNPIAANILMLALLIGGITGSDSIKKEVFPSPDINYVNISMTYLGASPTEVEQQIVIRIEEAIADLAGIFKITSTAQQNWGQVRVEVVEGYDVKAVLADIKSRVDAINTFPPSAERPVIRQQLWRNMLLWFVLSGDASKSEFKRIAYQVRDEMPLLEGISEVKMYNWKYDEVAIEISEQNLRRYNLTFDEVANAVRRSSINVPAGTIKTEQGSIQIQTRSQAYTGEDFADIVVRSRPDGSQLLLSDVADINDGFAEQDVEFIYKGEPAFAFEVKISDDPDLFAGTQSARDYVEAFNKTLPAGLKLEITFEFQSVFESRFNLLKDNALSGLALVFVILMLFLRPLLALWVVVGIVTAFAGAIWALPHFDVSLNMLSMFAFLMVLGIVVDDAIIVGESVYSRQHEGLKGRIAAVKGTRMVLAPVVLAVLSTIIFFVPMTDVPTEVKPFTISIFFVVMFCLLFSLVESLLILPSHLSHMKPEKPSQIKVLQMLERIRSRFSCAMESFANGFYQKTLIALLQRKFSTVLGFIMVFAVALSMFAAGWIKSEMFPQVPEPFIRVSASFAEGSPYRYSVDLAKHFRESATRVSQDPELLEQNGGRPFINEINTTSNGNNANMDILLPPPEQRDVSVHVIRDKIKQQIGELPEVKNYSLVSTFGGGAADIQLNLYLSSNDVQVQQSAVDDVTRTLAAYEGVENVRSNLDTGRLEVEVELKPFAQSLGITTADVARQIRQSFYGEELQRIPRSKEDVRVMLRYPKEDRQTLDTLDEMRIRNAQGIEVPLDTVAKIHLVPGTSKIQRTDRVRNITITADLAEGFDSTVIVTEMQASYSQQWQDKYPGFKLSTDGNTRAQAQFGDNFRMNFLLAFLVAFSLFAIAFRSVYEPLLILLAVPFGFMGAIFGHLLLGHNISMMSFFGFLACSGVVVNDNLVLLERIKQLREKGANVFAAVKQAGVDRFRAIVLTSLTTFAGLLPILFERSTQAQYLIPMVISLAFGVLFASTVTLYLVPCAYLGGHSIGQRLKQLILVIKQKLGLVNDQKETSASGTN
ncbi:AcrB/AcrD/AcrF family protein [Saccharobesus litoralis]|uniref:AcrB/AcrD/AcrF family protein n=1 Tax=Saccharobesus litoralis TaxID=2172099 RepID=A0A2S0VM43_9ALTE|nr:efflux RND transporter permease subunit [Saccharobesus litoralis]AWB65281.1 AcrB/AcrD/AcrF family protein [Saccharobesus litoralis]